MRAFLLFFGIVAVIIVLGVMSAFIVASEEDLWNYDESCNYRNCPGNCDKCSERKEKK